MHAIITDGDLRRALAKVEDLSALTAATLMTENAVSVHSDSSLQDAVRLMEERKSQIAVYQLPTPSRTRQSA